MANLYKLGDLIGCGGMGQVHAARDAFGRVVAVKRVHDRLSTDPVFLQRFAEEARLLRSVSHPNVVRVLDHGTTDDGLPYLVMDHASGEQLSDVVAVTGAMAVDRLTVISSQLLAGIAAIHDAGIVHADIKSANVLVDEVDVVTLIDFGLARKIDAVMAKSDVITGTPAYMAPEVLSGGPATIASDVYAAATIVYELLTGSTPFIGTASVILARQLSETVEAPSKRAPGRHIPKTVDGVVMLALDPSLAVRYTNIRDFASDLDRALASMPLEANEDFWDNSRTVMRLPSLRDAWIEESLARARRLVSRDETQVATFELETTLATLVESDPASPSAWRIETMLAGIHADLGQFDRARRIANVAYKRALRSKDPVAEKGARELVEHQATGETNAQTIRMKRFPSGTESELQATPVITKNGLAMIRDPGPVRVSTIKMSTLTSDDARPQGRPDKPIIETTHARGPRRRWPTRRPDNRG